MFAIGETAEKSGVKTETIRFYERTGIVPKPKRSANGQRVYMEEDVTRLSFIRRCRDHGFSLPQAKEMLSLASNEIIPCEDVRAIAKSNLDDINQKILELQTISAILASLVTECENSEGACPIVESLYGN